MANVVIPVTNEQGNYTLKCTLDNKVYGLGFRWNERYERWFMDIFDATNTLLIAGLPILEGWGLTDQFIGRIAGMPPGRFVAFDGTGNDLDPDAASFGVESQLLYIGVT